MQWAEKNYTAAAILFISVIWVTFIGQKEYKKRKKINENPDLKIPTHNIYYIWLNRWSFLAILSCFIASILYTGRYLPYICIAAVGIDQAFLYITKAIIGCYQIARLQYCFLDKQIHSKKYGYHQSLFTFLYINGVLLMIFNLICCTLFLYKTESFGATGCGRPFHPYWWVYSAIVIPWYYLWDWLILALYITKIVQIHRKKSAYTKAGDEQIIKRIRLILHKIFVLTIMLEISSILFTMALQFFVVRPFQSEWHGIIINATSETFDISLMVSIMYLMIDHNDAMYLKVIMILDKMYCCICCRCLVDKDTAEELYRLESVKYNNIQHEEKNEEPQNNLDANMQDLKEPEKLTKKTTTTKSDPDPSLKNEHSAQPLSKSEKSQTE